MDDLDIDFTTHLGFQTTPVFRFQLKKIRKKWEEVFEDSPHLAVTDNTAEKWQWLSDGYYFWLNSDRFAHWWGKQWFKQYAITKYTIKIDRTQLLDLITNPDHIEYFYALLASYQEVYDQAVRDGEAQEMIEPSVCAALTYFREAFGDDFPYQAIMTVDDWKDFKFTPGEIRMAPNSKDHEVFTGIQRAQICVFEKFKDTVLFRKTAYSPKPYVETCSA